MYHQSHCCLWWYTFYLKRNRRDFNPRSPLARIASEALFEYQNVEGENEQSQELQQPSQPRPHRRKSALDSQTEIIQQRYPGPPQPKWKIPPSEWQTIVNRIEQNHEPLRQVARDYEVSYETIRRVLKAAHNAGHWDPFDHHSKSERKRE